MKVILKQDVPGLGAAGVVKEVATGYARNYLIPRGLAVAADASMLKAALEEQKAREEHEARIAGRAAELAEKMAALTLTFQAKAGPTGRLYGSVTPNDIAEALEKELGVQLDRRKVLCEPLRDVGDHAVTVRLSRDVEGQVRVRVQAEGVEEPVTVV